MEVEVGCRNREAGTGATLPQSARIPGSLTPRATDESYQALETVFDPPTPWVQISVRLYSQHLKWPGRVAHTCNPRTWKWEAGGYLSLRPVWSTEKLPGQQVLHRNALSFAKPKIKKFEHRTHAPHESIKCQVWATSLCAPSPKNLLLKTQNTIWRQDRKMKSEVTYITFLPEGYLP